MNRFEDFRGNERIVRTLRQALASGRLPHSLLFAGAEGVGKRTLALMLAKALNCLQETANFCGECASCRKIDAGTHPDVLWVGLREDKHFLQIDQIREARGEVFYQPFEGRNRVILIDEADRMKDDAANSILKMLEEPPPSTKIILLTKKFFSLLTTIRSRCQIFYFSPAPLQLVREFLEAQTQIPLQDRELTARLAQGSFGKALAIDLATYRSQRSEVLDLVNSSVKSDSAEAVLMLADAIGKQKDSFEEYLDCLYLLFQDLFYIRNGAPEERITNIDVLPALQNLSKTVSGHWANDAVAELDSIAAGLRVNINRPIALENLAFQLGGQVPKSSSSAE